MNRDHPGVSADSATQHNYTLLCVQSSRIVVSLLRLAAGAAVGLLRHVFLVTRVECVTEHGL